MFVGIFSLLLISFVYTETQICEEEVTEKGISVTWHQSSIANNVQSDPVCYNNDNIVTRNCTSTNWHPPLPILEPCSKVAKHYDLMACPPSFDRILENNNEHCYQISQQSPWKYPCIKSGGAPLITDLSEGDVSSLLNSLRTKNISRFYWLPARRVKIFNPVRWTIPGPRWGWQVTGNNSLRIQTSFIKNCLLLDIEQSAIVTESCSMQYPSLCFYINQMHYPAVCPKEYHAFRFMPKDGVCYGIEQSDTKLTFEEFLLNKCSNPMGDGNNDDLTRFLFKKIAKLNNLSDNMWCWFTRKHIAYDFLSSDENETTTENSTTSESAYSYVIINSLGTLNLINSSTPTTLPCMACETKMTYGQPEFVFEYSVEEQLMYLTVYFPSGLWKYKYDDRGIQCFSNAKGFVNVIDVSDMPVIEIRSFNSEQSDFEFVEKSVYLIKLVTDRSAQYWCEGHTKNFSLITTKKIVVSPQGNKEHVFSLVIKTYIATNDIYKLDNIMKDFSENITAIFDAKKTLIMDILEYSMEHLLVLFHLHIEVLDIYNNDSQNIVNTYENLKTIARNELFKYNYTFVNISSSLFCLPTISNDNLIKLNWEMTSIGHIAAPTQFCLQANGLPVKRFCSGSYLLGSKWGDVEGNCDKNYIASNTTTFLYSFVKSQLPENYVCRFLTDGLGFVLDDVGQIIPADIYYLSMSLKHVLSIAQINHTLVDMGDIDNTAWVIDRILSLECNYLRLAQTLNSTNVILDSINDIIEILSYKKASVSRTLQSYDRYKSEVIAVQPQCVIYISYPHLSNVSGIAIINKAFAKKFTDMEIKPLYRNSTLDDVLSIQNLEVAAWLPDNVLKSLQRKENISSNATTEEKDVYVIMTVFHNDAIFQELEKNDHEINSRVIGISIPGFVLNLNSYVPLLFKNLYNSSSEKFCGYWDFETSKKGNIPGSWSRRGCFLKKFVNNISICECYHLTHFGHLINIGNKYGNHINEHHTRALNIITLVGSFLSIIGIVCIWVTASVFQTWRKKAGTKVLLHLSASIALPLLFLVVFNLDNTIFGEQNGVYVLYEHMEIVCIVLGALLHYSILASFMWMLLTAILQFIRYVRVLGVRRPSRFMLKLTIIGWGTPVIPVLAVVLINKENYIPDLLTCYQCYICYPKDIFLIICVVVPICIILLINIILFVFVLWSISKGPDGKMRTSDLDLIGAQLRLSIFLFFLLGLSWIFGIFSFSRNLIWSYLFCLSSSLQGFVLFVYFILCDPNTRNLWVTLMKPQYRPNISRESITSISSG